MLVALLMFEEKAAGIMVLLLPFLYYMDWLGENFDYFFSPNLFCIDYGSNDPRYIASLKSFYKEHRYRDSERFITMYYY